MAETTMAWDCLFMGNLLNIPAVDPGLLPPNANGALFVRSDAPDGGNGTMRAPFNTVAAAHAAAWGGAVLVVEAGVYPEALTLDKPATLLTVNGMATIGAAP